MSELKNVWLWVDGVTTGPYTASTVSERVARGEVGSTYFQVGGTGEWKPLAEWNTTPQVLVSRARTDSAPRPEKRKNSPAAIGGVCALIAAFAPLAAPVLLFFLSLPLLAAAFIFAIISLVRGRVAGGIILLIAVFGFAGPMAFVAAVGDQTRHAMLGSAQSDQIDPVKRSEKLQQAYANHRVFIGMTADEIKISWGSPTRSNRNIYSDRVSEQWIYQWTGGKSTYLYLDDGVLRSLQESQ